MSNIVIIPFILILISSSYSQKDSTRIFIEDEIIEVKEWRGIGYFLTGDSSVMKLVSCRNSNEVCLYRFYLIKYNYIDSTLHLIGEGINIKDSSRFDFFKLYIGKITDKNYLNSSYKFEKVSFGVFDIIFKVKSDDLLFINIGNYYDQIENVLFYSMDSFNIGEMIYGK